MASSAGSNGRDFLSIPIRQTRLRSRTVVDKAGDTHEQRQPAITQELASDSSHLNMIRSVTPSDGSVHMKFTKTGRVSKATKGERVHACDECGKVYTRAEHLRRHMKNHSPGSLPCDAPGCGRSFFREDLLLRHKQRHAEPDVSIFRDTSVDSQLTDEDYRRHSSVSQFLLGSTPGMASLDPESVMRGSSQPSTTVQPEHREHSFDPIPLTDLSRTPSFGSKVFTGYVPFEQLPYTTQAASVYGHETTFGYNWDPPTPPSYAYSSSNIEVSPRQPYYHPHDTAYGYASDASIVDFPNCGLSARSPLSASSALPVLPVADETWQASVTNTGTPSSENSYTRAHHGLQALGSFCRANSLATVSTLEEREYTEDACLQTPFSGLNAPEYGRRNDSTHCVEQRYLAAYWHALHPSWSILHRSSFSLNHASPLLRAAMLALGAQSTGEVTDLSNARVLHERCIKVLRRRTINNLHSFRIVDMQAIILVELFSLFRSRRPPSQLSRCFENVHRHLANDADAYANPLDFAELHAEPAIDIQHEAKRRLLIACYMLDRQQSLFFGRQPGGFLALSAEQLVYPRSTAYWDAGHNLANTQHDLASYGSAYEVLNTSTMPGEVNRPRQDVFRSMHLITCFNDTIDSHLPSAWRSVDSRAADSLLASMDDSPRTRLAYHLSLLCKLTPVRDLLAVAGESWVMAEKITSQGEYSAAQLDVQQWANARTVHPQSAHLSALSHALSILDLHRRCPKTGLLAQNWALYLASLVIWISAYTSTESHLRARISPGQAVPASHELERAVVALTQADPLLPLDWQNVSCTLLWAKGRLEAVNIPHNCGLTNGALDVLGKVISRGHEQTWLC